MELDEIVAAIADLKKLRAESDALIKGLGDRAKQHPELLEKTRLLDLKNQELISILELWRAALEPFEPHGEWKGQGWIANARKWIDLVKAQGSAKEMPDFIAAAETDARQFFHRLNEMRDLAQRDAPHEYERFIAEADALSDEARELGG